MLFKVLIDEIDKVGNGSRGDPSSALLEVLDPEQNSTFRDNYLDVPFDLSSVLFICTANVLDTIPPALLDRMEILELQGYTEQEKFHIATRYLIPKQTEAHGIKHPEQIKFGDGTIPHVIRHYTREAGVRNLEREIATLCRKQARKVAEGSTKKLTLNSQKVEKLLGVPRFRQETEIVDRTRNPGVAVGLAWTPTGGDVLFVEANLMRGGKNFNITGQVGPVMQESMQAALTWVRSHASNYKINTNFFGKNDVHVHVPAGAIPKDGPSAGVTMVTSLVSALTGRSTRPNWAMTGEITLSGMVLPVGGLKEKILAAKRANVKHIILPRENKPNVQQDIPNELLGNVKLYFVKKIEDILELVLEKEAINTNKKAPLHKPTRGRRIRNDLQADL